MSININLKLEIIGKSNKVISNVRGNLNPTPPPKKNKGKKESPPNKRLRKKSKSQIN